MTLIQLLTNLGLSISANAIYDFLKSLNGSSNQISYTLLKTKLGTFLRIKNVNDPEIVAGKILDVLKENKEIEILKSGITILDGEHIARGRGKITAIHTTKPTFFKPGTKSLAEGEGEVTATKIGGE
jgi:hypothetical protein